jgi:hypothetical protein
MASSPVVLLADLSEFQPDISDALYLAWSRATIIRACYGDAHDDKAWYGGQRRALLHAGGVKFLGIYQFLVAGQSGAAQAQAFHRLVGPVQPGEVFIADFEEGQHSMLSSWYSEMVSLYGQAIRPYLWTYTGLSFGQAQNALPVEWIAAYQSNEPASPHKLWQFTDSYQVPGVGRADCSRFRGTIDQLAALAYQPAKPAPQPAPKPAPVPLEDDMAVEIPPGSKSPDVGVSFNGAPYTTIGFLADPSRVGAAQTAVRCAFHKGKTATFAVETATMTPASPKVVVKVPANADGVSFHRLDDAPITLYPNFA